MNISVILHVIVIELYITQFAMFFVRYHRTQLASGYKLTQFLFGIQAQT